AIGRADIRLRGPAGRAECGARATPMPVARAGCGSTQSVSRQAPLIAPATRTFPLTASAFTSVCVRPPAPKADHVAPLSVERNTRAPAAKRLLPLTANALTYGLVSPLFTGVHVA